MKLIKYANGKQTIKLTKAEWENIGKTAGWDTEENLNRRKDYLNRLPVEYKPSKYNQEDDEKQFITNYEQPKNSPETNINKDLRYRKMNHIIDEKLNSEEKAYAIDLCKEIIKAMIANGINFNNRPFSKEQLLSAKKEIENIPVLKELKGFFGDQLWSSPLDLLNNLENAFEKINENEFVLNYSSWKMLFQDLFSYFSY